MEEALGRVRAELGPDALILSTRRRGREDGVFGWLGRAAVEVTAAVDREARSRTRGTTASHDSWKGLAVTRALVDPLEREVRELRQSVERIANVCSTEGELRRGVAELRRAIGELDSATPGSRRAGPNAGQGLDERLRAQGLASRHACRLAQEVEHQRRSGEGEWRCLRRVLARDLEGRLLPPRPDVNDRAALFVGATGVGKTTTLAKVAGGEIESEATSVVFTTDAWRTGGEQQLRVLAQELEVPFRVALSAGDLAQQAAHFERRRVLVDTAGRSPSDPLALPELLECRKALGRRAWVALVVSATTKESDLRAEIERHRALQPDALVVTRFDESADLWNVANVLLDPATPPLAWIGTGQRVPEDLLIPEPGEMAERIVGTAA